MTVTTKELSKYMGWNSHTWAGALRPALQKTRILERNNLSVLEIGAGRLSALSPLFFRNNNHVLISYYDENTKDVVVDVVEKLRDGHRSDYRYDFKQLSFLDLQGEYDVIILKSVLGGIFRKGESPQEIDKFLSLVVDKNLKKDGVLLTLDNGVSFYNGLISQFGARKKNWRFFRLGDFSNAQYQFGFGFFGAFSLGNRFGKFGRLIDRMIYMIDAALHNVIRIRPTVICSVYKKTL